MRGGLRRWRSPVRSISGEAMMLSYQRTKRVRKGMQPRSGRPLDRIQRPVIIAGWRDFVKHHESEIVTRHRRNRAVPIRRKVSYRLDVRFDLDSASNVSFIERHGECDLPTRRHAEESRPALLQGRGMSAMQAISAKKRTRLIAPHGRVRVDPRSSAEFWSDSYFSIPPIIPVAILSTWPPTARRE
jgi:hypothetical protein